MKPEWEIRQLRDALEVLDRQPCECRGTAHQHECITGGKMMKAVIRNLSWALGEDEEMGPHVRRIVEAAAYVERPRFRT